MRPLRILFELPCALTLLTGMFTIAAHTISFMAAPKNIAQVDWSKELEKDPRRAVVAYCASCHHSGRSGMDFDEETLNLDTMRRNRSAWEEVVRRLRTREMPPRQFPQPPEEVRAAMIAWIDQAVLQHPVETD